MKNRVFKKIMRTLLLVFIGAAVIGTFYFLWKKAQPVITVYEVVEPKTGTVETKAVATGNIEPRYEVEIKPQISGIIADEMAIGMINQKTTAVRLIPVIGKDVGDTAKFGGLLGYAPIIPVNEYDCSAFVSRKGRIPAPIHSFKN